MINKLILKISFTDILWMLWKIPVRKSLLLLEISFMDILQVLWKIPVRKSLLLERYPLWISCRYCGGPCEEIPPT